MVNLMCNILAPPLKYASTVTPITYTHLPQKQDKTPKTKTNIKKTPKFSFPIPPFPHPAMAVRATMTRFAADPDAQEASGLPWGVTLTPFAAKDENGNPPVYGSDGDLLPRCENCWAYYNTYCDQEQWAWTCSLCGTLNGLSSQSVARYSLPQSCAENMSSFIDLELPSKFYTSIYTYICDFV